LPLGVDPAHVDRALQTHERGCGSRGHAVLSGAGLGDDAPLAHPAGEQRLGQDVVDLVAARVVQVLSLEDHPGAAGVLGEARHLGDDARAAGVGPVQPGELVGELRVRARLASCLVQLLEGGDQRLGHEAPAEGAETARAGVLPGALGGLSPGHRVTAAPSMPRTPATGSPPTTSAAPTRIASAPARRKSAASSGPRTPDSATRTRSCGMSGASRAKVVVSTSRVFRLRLFTPMTRAPRSTARPVSASSCTSTRLVMPSEPARCIRSRSCSSGSAATMSSTMSAPWARASQTWY